MLQINPSLAEKNQHVQYNTLTNRITTTNTLLQADFSTLETIAYSSVASNFTNIIGALIEAYMILNLRSRVSTIENTYLKSSFLRSPTFELAELVAGTRWIMTSDELISFVEGGITTLAELQAGTNTLATTNEIYQWINPLHRAEVLTTNDFIATNNEVLSWVDKTYTSQVSAGTDYITTDAAVASKYATTVITDGLQSEIGANTTAITTLQMN